jgi:hypothetical protein
MRPPTHFEYTDPSTHSQTKQNIPPTTMKFASFDSTDDTLLSISGITTLGYGLSVRVRRNMFLTPQNPHPAKPSPRKTRTQRYSPHPPLS